MTEYWLLGTARNGQRLWAGPYRDLQAARAARRMLLWPHVTVVRGVRLPGQEGQ